MASLRTYPLIWLIRHAEKPDVQAGIAGIDEQGRADPASLSRKGWRRARLLADVLEKIGPSALYAARPRSGSRRPSQTLAAASRRLKLPVREDFGTGQVVDLLADVLRQPGLVVVCWRHGELADIANVLAPRHVESWDPACYDRRWELRWLDGSWSFQERALALLPGDRALTSRRQHGGDGPRWRGLATAA